MRACAKRPGLTLTDTGLARCERRRVGAQKKVTKVAVRASVTLRNEWDLFGLFGIGYVPPRYRICADNDDGGSAGGGGGAPSDSGTDSDG